MITHSSIMRRAAALAVFAFAAVCISTPSGAQKAHPSETSTATAPEVPTPLSPEADALRTELLRLLGGKSGALAAYVERDFKPLWLDDDGRTNAGAKALLAALGKTGDHALPVERYDMNGLAARLDAGGMALEAALTAAYLTYARDITSGVLEPRGVDRELHVFPERPDAATLIAGAAGAEDMATFLENLQPKNPLYARLVTRYSVFRDRASEDIWGAEVPSGRSLRPGDKNSRVAAARARLVAMGDLEPAAYTTGASAQDGERVAANEVTTDVPAPAFEQDHYDEIMVEAVKRFQGRHGLNTDGVIGPATLRQLNTSPGTRAEQIAVNLERLRWMNRDLGERHILVNLAGFTMAVINRGKEDFSSRVVVGKARKHRTPEFSEIMTHMIVNPSWHVPRSIATKEILPILKEDPGYLARKGMRLVGGEPPEDWTTVTPGTFPGRIVQRPGSGNALGSVKFMFPNRFSIYLHDTPSKRLFSRDVRAFSHGCIRVEKPEAFAAYLLTGQAEDPLAYFREVRERRGERRINLEDPLPVHVTYRSAWIDDHGVDQFRGDIYGRDTRIARALKQAGVTILQ